jgi:Vam6/Vps39-like protein vacuolar protein sorting-associated protein 39
MTFYTQRSQSLTGEIHLVVRLCVAVKRRLQFYYWKNQNLLEFAKDIELKDIPKILSWSLNYVVVGFKTEYVIYDVSISVLWTLQASF